MRKCASTPTLHSMSAACGGESDSQGMEVYVVLRPFKVGRTPPPAHACGMLPACLHCCTLLCGVTKPPPLPAPIPAPWTVSVPASWLPRAQHPSRLPQEFGGGLFNRMPRRLRAGVRDAGICHYLAVFKQRDGSLVQFDFGPRGGDIHVARGPFAFLSKSADGKMRRHVPGEVRERRLVRLPEAHMFVGHTPLSLADIRAWNSLQEAGSMVRGGRRGERGGLLAQPCSRSLACSLQWAAATAARSCDACSCRPCPMAASEHMLARWC
jgi:hypothetical protein